MGPWREIGRNEKSVHIDCDGHVVEMSIDGCKSYHIADETQDLTHANRDYGEAVTRDNVKRTRDEPQVGEGLWDFSGLSSDMSPIFMIRTLS